MQDGGAHVEALALPGVGGRGAVEDAVEDWAGHLLSVFSLRGAGYPDMESRMESFLRGTLREDDKGVRGGN